jgi:tetratricopeptide (TPR) repeat protein
MANVGELLAQAENHLRRGEHARALQCLGEAVAREPGNAQAWFYKGCAHSELKDYVAAVECFKRSAAGAGDRASLPLYNLGNAYQALGRNADAMNAFREALKIDPRMADAWVNLGRLMDDSGDHEGATKAYDIALQFQDKDEICWCNRGNSVRALGRWKEALDCYDKSLALSNPSSENYFNCLVGVSMCLPNVGRAEEALGVVDELLTKRAREPVLLVQRCVVLGTLGRHAEALAAADHAIASGVRSKELWNDRGEVLAKLSRFDEALGDFDKAIALDRDFAPAWFGKARAAFNAGRHDAARAAIAEYRRTSKGKGDLGEAATALERLLKTSS